MTTREMSWPIATGVYMKTNLRLVRPRPRIKGGITCSRCGHERFKFMKSCPRCDDQALRELDTSTKELG